MTKAKKNSFIKKKKLPIKKLLLLLAIYSLPSVGLVATWQPWLYSSSKLIRLRDTIPMGSRGKAGFLGELVHDLSQECGLIRIVFSNTLCSTLERSYICILFRLRGGFFSVSSWLLFFFYVEVAS